MKITNIYNLPESFYNALKEGRRPQEGIIHVTELINPPAIYYLTLKHYDELEADISDMLWLLLGNAVHYYLENHTNKDNFLVEKTLTLDIDGIKLTGRTDLYDIETKTIIDYKVTSVYSFMFAKKEWEQQLNVYAYLLNISGYKVYQLLINAILRDWVATKVNTPNYPKIPFIRKEIPLWSLDEQERFIKERIQLFKQGLIECSDEEKWVRGGGYAIKQITNGKILRKADTLEELQNIILSENQTIEKIPSEPIRCKYYCPVSQFCPFYHE